MKIKADMLLTVFCLFVFFLSQTKNKVRLIAIQSDAPF